MVLHHWKNINLLEEICCIIVHTFNFQMMNIIFTQTVLVLFMYIFLFYPTVCFFGLLFTDVDDMKPCLEMSGCYYVR